MENREQEMDRAGGVCIGNGGGRRDAVESSRDTFSLRG